MTKLRAATGAREGAVTPGAPPLVDLCLPWSSEFHASVICRCRSSRLGESAKAMGGTEEGDTSISAGFSAAGAMRYLLSSAPWSILALSRRVWTRVRSLADFCSCRASAFCKASIQSMARLWCSDKSATRSLPLFATRKLDGAEFGLLCEGGSDIITRGISQSKSSFCDMPL